MATNVWVRDMDLQKFNAIDGRRLEVVADGLSLWRGAQLAIDTTLVSPLSRDGSASRRAANHDGAALQRARRRKEATYPELSGEGGRARLVVLAAEVGGRWSVETAQFCPHSPRPRRNRHHISSRAGWRLRGCAGGVPLWLALQHGPSQSLCWTGAQCQGRVTPFRPLMRS